MKASTRLHVFLAGLTAVAAATAMAAGVPSTRYSYDNNGNLHGTAVLPIDPACASVVVNTEDRCDSCTNKCAAPTANGIPWCTVTCSVGGCTGACSFKCNPGYSACPGTCVDLASDENNCGSCGNKCVAGTTCNGGKCPIVFSGVVASATVPGLHYGATVTWTTDRPTTSKVYYRVVSAGATPNDWMLVEGETTPATAHSVSLVDLWPLAQYEFYLKAGDTFGVTAQSALYGFNTPRGAYDVGVIPSTAPCPEQTSPVVFFLDNQNFRNRNTRWGWIGATISTTDTQLFFCRVDGRKFRPLSSSAILSYEYAVLQLSGTCPNGSVSFTRYFDTQDGGASGVFGDVWPSYLDGNRNIGMSFCLFRWESMPMSSLPVLPISYGVFAPTDFSLALATGGVFTDDASNVWSNANANAYSSPYPAETQRIVTSGYDTWLYMAQVR